MICFSIRKTNPKERSVYVDALIFATIIKSKPKSITPIMTICVILNDYIGSSKFISSCFTFKSNMLQKESHSQGVAFQLETFIQSY